MDTDTVLPLLAATLAAALFLWGSLRLRRRQRLLRDLPTSRAEGVFIGLVELKGRAESECPFTSHLAGHSCVYYQWRVEEHWSRNVTETVRDKDGRTRTRTRQQSGWKVVAQGGESGPFYLADETGVVRIQPAGAKVEPVLLFDEVVGRSDPLYYGKGPAHAVADSQHRRRFTEEGIVLHTPLYVVGSAREREDVVAAEIAESRDGDLFLISSREEHKVERGYAFWSWACWLLGLAAAAGGGAVLHHQTVLAPPSPWPAVMGGLASYVLLWLAAWTVMVYNSLVALRERVRQGWSLIDVQLRRRHDLIPALVAPLQSLAGHEQEVQRAVAALRTQAAATRPGAAGPDPHGVTGSVRAVVERYPQLMTQGAFAGLFRELVTTEQRIGLARSYYNDIATHLITRTQQIPDGWIARATGIRAEPLLETADFERAEVTVRLAS